MVPFPLFGVLLVCGASKFPTAALPISFPAFTIALIGEGRVVPKPTVLGLFGFEPEKTANPILISVP